jgi:RimJ/RimL family protein N-acetyltransferase
MGSGAELPAALGEVAVRYTEPKDWDSYIALDRSEVTMHYVGGVKLSEAQLLERLHAYRPSSGVLTIADAASDLFIGTCGILPEGEIFILLMEDRCRRGVARVVVPFLVRLAIQEGMRPFGCVHPENKASLALMQRLGWNRVGICEVKQEWQRGHLRFEPPSVTP